MGLAFLEPGGNYGLTLSTFGSEPSPGEQKLQGFLFGKIFEEDME
jgi:hypothetical protein